MKRIIGLLNLHEERGSVLVIVALSLVALMGFTALAIDGGRVYIEKSKLQKALDAAVTAGAQGLPTSEDWAKQIAKDFSIKNGYTLVKPEELYTTKYTIKADKYYSVPMTFGKVLGKASVNIHATATAKVSPLKSAGGVAPIAVAQSQIPNGTQLNCGKPGNGNCGFLRLDGSGASNLTDAFINGGTFEVGTSFDDTKVDTEPGKMVGPVTDAVNNLIRQDENANPPRLYCQAPLTADNTCSRVITIVVINNWDKCNGTCTRNVVGLASYWLQGMQGNKIIGQFIKMVSPGEIGNGTGTTIGDWNIAGVKLIE